MKPFNFIIALTFSLLSSAKADTPLYFTPDPKVIQVLPQKFEYTLVDSSSIQIGDILVDSKSLNMQLELNEKNPTTVRLIFTWPTGLTKEGHLVLYNNNGKSIFTQTITKDLTQVSEANQKSTNELVRKQVSTFSSDFLDEETSEELKYLPFMKFCISHEEKETRTELCSSELFVSSDNNKLMVKERKSAKRTSSVFINGKKVGDQGIIFLNDATESLSFKAQTESGAALEISTKLSPTEIKEIIITEDKKSLVITGFGSFPVQERNTKKISDSLWETHIPADFPILYLQGDGGIPIRQEFNLKGELPKEKYRVSVSGNAKTKSYSNEEKLTLKLPSNFTSKVKDENSKLSAIKNQKIVWTLSNLKQSELNRRQIYIQNKEQSYLLSYDVFRGKNLEFVFSSKYLTPAKINLAEAELIWWLNNLYSGVKVKTSSAIAKPQDLTAFSITEFSFLHRFPQGLNHQDNSLVLGINYQLLKSNTLTFSLPGASFGWERTPQSRWLKTIADWNKIYLNYYLGQKKEEANLNSVLEIEYLLQVSLFNSHYLNYGFGFSKYSFEAESDLSKNQLTATLGWSMLF